MQEVVQLVARHFHPDPVAGVQHEENGVRVLVVVLPQRAAAALPGHVEHCELDSARVELLHRVADRGRQILALVPFRLHVVQQRRFA